MVDSLYCFKKEKVFIGLELLWKVVRDEIRDRRENGKSMRSEAEETYYAYYFLLSAFRHPQNGLRKLDRISYNLEILTNLLFRLDGAIDNESTLWAINIYYLFKSFIKGLVLIGVARFKQDEKIVSHQFKSSDENIEVIKNGLKEDKVRNKDLLDSIQRLEVVTNAAKATKATKMMSEKELRYEREKLKELEARPKAAEPEPEQPLLVVNNATMNLRTMRELKYEYTQLSNLSVDYISEKEVLEAVYNRVFEENQQDRKQKRDVNPLGNILFLTGVTGHRKEAVQKDINERIPRGDSEYVIQAYPKEEIISAVRDYYDEKTKSFQETVELLEMLRIGEPRKISLCKLLKYLECEIPSEDLPRIFPFDFFLSGAGASNDEFR